MPNSQPSPPIPTTDEVIRNRRRLIQKLSVKLDEADPTKISNNDVRRMIDNLPRVLNWLRMMERYPKGIPTFDPCDVLRVDHVATDLLDRYAGRDLRQTLRVRTITLIESHLDSCSACQARLKYFESLLVVGQHVRRGNPNEPRRPVMDTSGISNPTTLNPHIGIAAGAWRDDQ